MGRRAIEIVCGIALASCAPGFGIEGAWQKGDAGEVPDASDDSFEGAPTDGAADVSDADTTDVITNPDAPDAADAPIDTPPDVDAAPAAATWTDVWNIISARCTPCHATSPNMSGGLRMWDRDIAYANLVGVTANCDGETPRVDPGNALHSMIFLKVREDEEGRCGARMPRGRPPLEPELIDQVESWINAGALNN